MAGVRPLVRSRDVAESAVSRAHRVVDHAQEGGPGLLSVFGAKITPYRSTAQQAVDLAMRLLRRAGGCRTAVEPLYGGATPPDALTPRVRVHAANLGLDSAEVDRRVREAIDLVGLDFDKISDVSPFELSGGQKRRVAIAGVLAMEPKVLILDEPAAGLDPKGRDEILGGIKKLHDRQKITVVLVSHSMEDIANLVDKVLVMNKGKIVFFDTPRNVFKDAETLEQIGLGVPQVTYLVRELRKKGFEIPDCINIEEAKNELLKLFRGKKL
jgi:ABC-type multidrug transport system ATPase subunit